MALGALWGAQGPGDQVQPGGSCGDGSAMGQVGVRVVRVGFRVRVRVRNGFKVWVRVRTGVSTGVKVCFRVCVTVVRVGIKGGVGFRVGFKS